MYVLARTDSAGWNNVTFDVEIFIEHLGRVTIMRHMLLTASRPALRTNDALALAHDPARIQGGNWQMQGFRRSGHIHDEAECEMSIAEFMVDAQERNDIVD